MISVFLAKFKILQKHLKNRTDLQTCFSIKNIFYTTEMGRLQKDKEILRKIKELEENLNGESWLFLPLWIQDNDKSSWMLNHLFKLCCVFHFKFKNLVLFTYLNKNLGNFYVVLYLFFEIVMKSVHSNPKKTQIGSYR